MTIKQGDCGGMELRYNSSTGKGYSLFVCSDGTYQFARYSGFNGSDETILNSGSKSGITSEQNTLAVIANGSSFTFYLNNSQLNSLSDSTYSKGEIGLFANDSHNPTEVIFQKARVWQ